MQPNNYRTWIELSRSALEHNLVSIKRLCEGSQLGIVVKSNAYGHGLHEICTLLEPVKDVAWFFTAGVDEALRIRQYGSKKNILAMAYLDSIPEAIVHGIDCVAYDFENLQRINWYAQKLDMQARVHLKVDTGMTRLGVAPREVFSIVSMIRSRYKAINLVGIFTHLSDTNNPDQSFSYEQLDLFNTTLSDLKRSGYTFECCHALSSGGLLLNYVQPSIRELSEEVPSSKQLGGALATSMSPLDRYRYAKKYSYDVTRVGTNLYGNWKSLAQRYFVTRYDKNFSLEPILSWKTSIVQIREVLPGISVGYNRMAVAQQLSRVAVIPVGYWDGYPREFFEGVSVLVGGQYAPLVGVVSMNFATIDITHIPEAHVGMHVTLLGKGLGGEDKISASALAYHVGTINNEILTRINQEIPRIIVD